MMDVDLDDEVENSEPSMELIVSDFGGAAPNLAPSEK
jgi:hypothetical protein